METSFHFLAGLGLILSGITAPSHWQGLLKEFYNPGRPRSTVALRHFSTIILHTLLFCGTGLFLKTLIEKGTI